MLYLKKCFKVEYTEEIADLPQSLPGSFRCCGVTCCGRCSKQSRGT